MCYNLLCLYFLKQLWITATEAWSDRTLWKLCILQSSWWQECKGSGPRCASGRFGRQTRPERQTHIHRLGGFTTYGSSWIHRHLVDTPPDKSHSNSTLVSSLKNVKIKIVEVLKLLSHLVLSRQVGGDSSGSLFSHWMYQQVSPCRKERNVMRTNHFDECLPSDFKGLCLKKPSFI